MGNVQQIKIESDKHEAEQRLMAKTKPGSATRRLGRWLIQTDELVSVSQITKRLQVSKSAAYSAMKQLEKHLDLMVDESGRARKVGMPWLVLRNTADAAPQDVKRPLTPEQRLNAVFRPLDDWM